MSNEKHLSSKIHYFRSRKSAVSQKPLYRINLKQRIDKPLSPHIEICIYIAVSEQFNILNPLRWVVVSEANVSVDNVQTKYHFIFKINKDVSRLAI